MAAFRTMWKHVRRSPYQAIAAILIISQTFFVISLFTFLVYGSSKIIAYFESKPQVTAFFKNETKQERIDELKKQVSNTGKISEIRYVTKKDALKIYKEQFKNDPLLLEFVTADILPASLEISTVKIEDLGLISDLFKKSPYVSDVIYQKDIIASLTSWTNALRQIGIALIIVFAIDSMLIMIIIIGIKISQKKEEIEIMRLIGATNWYVRWPFILEGMFYASVGAFFGWIFSAGLLLYKTPFLETFLRGIPVLPVSYTLLAGLLGIEILLAILLGIVSSFFAVLRYLK